MKKKTIITICCLASFCYAQTPHTAPIVLQDVEEKKSCSVVQEALSEDDFFFDREDDSNYSVTGDYDEPCTVISRLQDLVNTLGVQAILGALYISEVCSDAYQYVQGLLYEKK